MQPPGYKSVFKISFMYFTVHVVVIVNVIVHCFLYLLAVREPQC